MLHHSQPDPPEQQPFLSILFHYNLIFNEMHIKCHCIFSQNVLFNNTGHYPKILIYTESIASNPK